MKFARNAPIFAVMLSTQLLHQAKLTLAGMACFSACSVACCECAGGPAAFAGPLGIAVGVTGCAGVCMVACATLVWVPPACFSNDTTIAMYAPDGTRLEKPISAVRDGDSVLTMADGRPVPTRVIRNVQSSGSFDFFEFEVLSHHTIATLKVTSQHGMLLVDPLGEMRFALPGDVRVGDEMQSSDGSAWKVSRIGHSVGVDKFTLETTEGSVLASGLLVSTICEEEINAGTRMDDIMPGWKARHQYAVRSN
ncbi:hypothetical protein MGU_08041 [Metarhizium guizhouense ARSEF 977]|uniref:Hint domain-containing protein n=1 Tax=Metarhizium guizhouense (strain ARSEF 977) TaxID=1276136 RepID=A0A0B4H4H9_METGA|nr:hypothetical protein MGU_08041 [Metarhizium guizhouense ARSEF 977]